MQFARVNQPLKQLFVVYMLVRVMCYIVTSFTWTMDGDLSFLYYISWLMNAHDFVPYRDVHETSFFGTFIFYSTLTQLIGYSTLAFHIVDTVFFAALSLILFILLKPFGKWAGLLAIGLFGEFYYQYGAGVHLQRDFVALLPAALALLIASNDGALSIAWRSFWVGVLFGIASCIKPQFGLGLLALLPLIYFRYQGNRLTKLHLLLRIGIYSVAGVTLVWALGIFWLYMHGVLGNFLDMAFNYLPQYSSINGRNYARTSADALTGAAKWFGGMLLVYCLPLALGVAGAMRSDQTSVKQKVFVPVVLALWLMYLAYVPMAGKYWDYHILPSCYFLAIGLSLVAYQGEARNKSGLAAVSIFVVWLLLMWVIVLQQSFFIKSKEDVQFDSRMKMATQELAGFLKKNLGSGDTMQSHVSHTHGPIFPALLEAHAMPATPYLENYLLYHDVDKPFVKHAREQFMGILQERPPHFIIAGPTVFNFRGERTEPAFQPFEEWLAKNYHPVFYSSNLPGLGINEIYTVYQNNDK